MAVERHLSLLILFYLVQVAYSTDCSIYRNHADESTQVFLNNFWTDNKNYLLDTFVYNQGGNALTGYWTYAQGFDALLDAVQFNSSYLPWIEKFYNGQAPAGFYRPYYDDMNWMALALLRASQITASSNPTNSAKYLTTCQELFEIIAAGWDTTCCGADKGGIWWDAAHTSKATASNGGPAILGAFLYMQTNNKTYLTFSQKVFDFWWSSMANTATGQICDNIHPDGTKTWWKFTYNEGLMIGAATALYKTTGNSDYLLKAKLIVSFMLNNETVATQYGLTLTDGGDSQCGGDCQQFKGPAYRYLAYYFKVTQDMNIYKVLKSSVDSAWMLGRNSQSGFYGTNWAGPEPQLTDAEHLAQMTAATMSLSIFQGLCK